MDTRPPSLEDWKKLYSLMEPLKELAPWDYMHEDDIFGFQLPGTETLGFVSIMGTLGEHLSMAVYLGAKGLDGFWKMQELGDRLMPQFVLQIPQIQASFENREDVTDEDRKIIKSLGLKFRGAQSWPQFRSFRPGCFPWYIEKWEADLLICALEQVLEVAPRFRENPDIFMPTDSDDDYLVRVRKNDQWEDTVVRVEPLEEHTFRLKMNMKALSQLKQQMPGKMIIEADFFMLDQQPTQEKRKERPFFPFMLLLVDHDSQFILGSKLLSPLPSMEAMMEEVPAKLVEALAKGFPPKEIHVKDGTFHTLLQPVAEEVGFKLVKASRLRAIEMAQREFSRFMGMGF